MNSCTLKDFDVAGKTVLLRVDDCNILTTFQININTSYKLKFTWT